MVRRNAVYVGSWSSGGGEQEVIFLCGGSPEHMLIFLAALFLRCDADDEREAKTVCVHFISCQGRGGEARGVGTNLKNDDGTRCLLAESSFPCVSSR